MDIDNYSTDRTDAVILCILTGIGLIGNFFMISSIILRKSLRKVVNMFLLHHCFINFVQCLLFIPFIIALLNDEHALKGCEIIGGLFVTMVTATVINIAAMTACEAYRFEDLVQEQNENFLASNNGDPNKKKMSDNQAVDSGNGTASYTCVLFGIFMIWLSSIILHLGMTLIGSDPKQFYNYKIRNCFLVIGDKQTYILYIMWILLTAVSLILTIIYVKRIYKDVSKRKYQEKSNFFITSPLFYEKKNSIKLNNDIDRPISFNPKSGGNVDLNRNNKFSHSYDSLNELKPMPLNNTSHKHIRNMNLKNDCFLSHSTSKLSSKNNKNLNCALFYSKSIGNFKSRNNSSTDLAGSNRRPAHQKKRRFNFVKLILQRIKIQFLVIKLFIICWLPLFLTVLIDTQFKVSPNIYRWLILIAFSNSSLTPYCYLTILIPGINKYCLPCLRTDGKQSKRKTLYYNEMERYYERLGDRMHNSSRRSSLASINFYQNNNKNKENGYILNLKNEAICQNSPWEQKPDNDNMNCKTNTSININYDVNDKFQFMDVNPSFSAAKGSNKRQNTFSNNKDRRRLNLFDSFDE